MRYGEHLSVLRGLRTWHVQKPFAREPGDLRIDLRCKTEVRMGKTASQQPVMHDPQKSDPRIVAMKSANKPEGTGAESMERRRGAKGNAKEVCTRRTQSRGSVSPELERVRERAKRNRKERFTSLLHHIDVELLRWSYWQLKRDAAPGVDGQTWEAYGEQLERNLLRLHESTQRGAYRAQPSRRQFIPKEDGRERPLGIAAVEDKVLQRAMVEVLNAIYEVDFQGFSYGFRPGGGQHDALDALAWGITRTKVNWIVDADIAGFFDRMSHEWLIRFIEHRIGDPRVVRLIRKWLQAGVMEDGVLTVSTAGTPQGAVISPLLANIYLHYTFDLWAKRWRHREARGNLIMVRYADDIVCGFAYPNEAQRFLRHLRQRLERFALSLHPDKTRLIEFGRFAAENRKKRGLGKPETFDFLGFTHICGHCFRNDFQLWRKSRRDRLRNTLRDIGRELRVRRHASIKEQGKWLRAAVQGVFAYHAVPSNLRTLKAFREHLKRYWCKALRRRGQRHRVSWERVSRLVDRWVPPVRALHPWPDARFRVKHPRWEPSARIAPARICAGGVQQ
jgi:group II intron reverse transcriptase/maturase